MKIFDSVRSIRAWRKELEPGLRIGFVPTMGALHAGHASLIDRAKTECDRVVLSIFVNPTQFNQAEDFEKYPKTWEQDLEIAKRHGVDAIFHPGSPDELYPDQYAYRISETPFSASLCGEFRPGHFEGVLSVVMKLLQTVRPDRAYFGEKDYQQLALIEGMTRAFFLDVEIVPCATLREKNGLALSSRNLRLSPEEKESAPLLYRTLRDTPDALLATEHLTRSGFRVEYIVDREILGKKRRFAAAWLGSVRLIDNVEL